MTIADLTQADIGKRVIYAPMQAGEEAGFITSWNEDFVFVRYPPDRHSKATRPEDLEFAG